MKTVLKLSIIILLFSCNKNEASQEQVKNDCIGEYTTEEIQETIVSAFFGLDNALPSLLLCNQQAGLIDGMPVNFKFPIDGSWDLLNDGLNNEDRSFFVLKFDISVNFSFLVSIE